MCIDEVHMLTEERGSVLEVIVARMKTLGTSGSCSMIPLESSGEGVIGRYNSRTDFVSLIRHKTYRSERDSTEYM